MVRDAWCGMVIVVAWVRSGAPGWAARGVQQV